MSDRLMFMVWDSPEMRGPFEVWEMGDACTWYRRDEMVVRQSTGLIDKNGKLIFEGDIIAESTVDSIIWDDVGKVIERPIGVVKCCPPYTTLSRLKKGKVALLVKKKYFGNVGDTVDLNLTFYDGLYQWPNDIEIIGNIYEHPHLVEGEEQ